MKRTIFTVLTLLAFNTYAEDLVAKYTAALQKITSPNVKVKTVNETPMKGVMEILVDSGRGSEIYYISDDGKFLINGTIFDIENKADLTEKRKSGMRIEMLEQFSDSGTIDFLPEDMKHHVTVFTDIDCGYCRKMHAEMEQYNELGIGISYLFFPRAGIKSGSYDKAVTVWCSKDQQEAMTQSKAGVSLDKKICDNPIEDHYTAGVSSGVNGTPAMVLDNGTMMPGYLPPAKLKERLDMMASK